MDNPKTLYLVDDDVDDLDFFREAVNSIDSSIICFSTSDSEKALHSFQMNDVPLPDLIFLDLNMPLVDGRTFLVELKKLKPYAQIPVIIYSTSCHPRDIVESKQLGAAYFITKPYTLDALISELNEVFSNYSRDLEFSDGLKEVISKKGTANASVC